MPSELPWRNVRSASFRSAVVIAPESFRPWVIPTTQSWPDANLVESIDDRAKAEGIERDRLQSVARANIDLGRQSVDFGTPNYVDRCEG